MTIARRVKSAGYEEDMRDSLLSVHPCSAVHPVQLNLFICKKRKKSSVVEEIFVG